MPKCLSGWWATETDDVNVLQVILEQDRLPLVPPQLAELGVDKLTFVGGEPCSAYCSRALSQGCQASWSYHMHHHIRQPVG